MLSALTRRAITAALSAALIAFLAHAPARAQDASDLSTLRSKSITATGPGALAYLKKRTPAEDTIKKIDKLIKDLDDDSPEVRDKATTAVAEFGPLARGKLAEAAKSKSAEVRRRARLALEKIPPTDDDAVILPAVARVLAATKPEGSLQAVLTFLPHIEKQDVADEVAGALAPLAVDKGGKADPLAVKALTSPSPVVRAAAGQALAGVKAERVAVHKLLADANVGVRRRVALALLQARDKDAIPALIELTGNKSADDATAAEDALSSLAGEKAPAPVSDSDPKALEKTKANWARWWKEAGPKFDLAKADLNALGRGLDLLCVLPNVGRTDYQILGRDSAGRMKFKISYGTRLPTHASMSRRDRLLVCEWSYSRVQEIDTSGKVQWTKNISNPLCAYRLRNGHTFIACRNQLIVLDRDNKEIRNLRRPSYDVASAMLFPNGTISMLTTGGSYIRFDKDNKATKTVYLGRSFTLTGMRCHFNADGSFIAPDYNSARVRAYDADGKQKWEATVSQPSSVTQLPSGNLIIASQYLNSLTELNRDGKSVGTKTVPEGRVMWHDRR